jgi:hypothetical protein
VFSVDLIPGVATRFVQFDDETRRYTKPGTAPDPRTPRHESCTFFTSELPLIDFFNAASHSRG